MRGITEIMRATWGRVVLLLTITLSISACSDGASVERKPNTTIAPPAIELFSVASVADPGNVSTRDSDALYVESGDSVTVSWKVAGADTITITSDKGTLSESVSSEGSLTTTALANSEVFTIVASIEDISIDRSVLVSVARPAPTSKVLEFAPTSASIDAGEGVQICFAVQPLDATVEVSNKETGDTIAIATDNDATGTYEAGSDNANTSDTPELTDTTDTTDTTNSDDQVDDAVETVNDDSENTLGATALMKLSLNVLPPQAANDEDVVGNSIDEVAEQFELMSETTEVATTTNENEIMRGCTVEVFPAATTVYVVLVTDSNGVVATRETTVQVNQEVQVTIAATPASLLAPGAVTLNWSVSPATAKVSIDKIGDVTAQTNDGMGSASDINVIETTTFTITATDENSGKSAQGSVTVSVVPPQMPNLVLSASTTDVFAGEEVTFTVSGAVGSATLMSPDGSSKSVTDGTIKVTPAETGAYYVTTEAVEGAAAGVVPRSEPVNINVRKWDAARGSGKAWTAVGVHPGDASLVVSGDMSNTIKLSVGAAATTEAWSESEVNFKTEVMKTIYKNGSLKLTDDAMNQIGPFPAGAFAFDTVTGRVYAGLTGLVMYSDDKGKSWNLVDAVPVILHKGVDVDNAVSHPSCKGRTQVGLNGKHTSFVNVQQICGLALSTEGQAKRLIVATDYGIYSMDGIDTYITNKKESGLKWSHSEEVRDFVAHDLAVANKNGVVRVYAATDKGVYSNFQGGASTWQQMNGGSLSDTTPVYAVATDNESGEVYAATADGKVYRSEDLTNGNWNEVKSFDAKVYSLAVDGKTGTLLAGVESGVYVSRDRGDNWSDISQSMAVDSATVYDVSVVNVNDMLHYAAATNMGVYIAHDQRQVVVARASTPVAASPVTTDDSTSVDDDSTSAAGTQVHALSVSVVDGALTPTTLTAKVGDSVELSLDNREGSDYLTIAVKDPSGSVLDAVGGKAGEKSATITVMLTEAGTYQYYAVDGGGSAIPGLTGTITVGTSGATAAMSSMF